jgi:lipopolysaccharide assembly protein B
MEFEFWWLLAIPVVFAAGWFASKFDGRQALRQSRELPEAYFQGLNFLLNEQPDKAIDAFTEVVRLDPETSELHFALGNLFRRRGETERAIRIHKALVERSDLSNQQRQQALHELGQDYFRAGLLDRAEETFKQLEGGAFAVDGLKHRLSIAQLVRDWTAAIGIAQQLRAQSSSTESQVGRRSGSLESQIAHFHCELAASALNGNSAHSASQAAEHLDRALEVQGNHPRALLMRAQLQREAGDFARALKTLNQLADSEPAFVALAPQEWLAVHHKAGLDKQGRSRLETIMEARSSVDLLTALASEREEHLGLQTALDWTRLALPKAPSLSGLAHLLDMSERAGTQFPDAAIARDLVKSQALRLGKFSCKQCGFQAKQYYWQCPGCNQWDSTEPRRLEEQEIK